ncbi:histidine kinase dimerization/phospho-acceptor domain-containing protein [Virgibacillus siamensis]|uniref:histidine kinase dimerization/phospho-acceptor domain-containing protein n=1 Tax=Virgibacillus siamensis TaxID=480071 RepID=UPI001115663D|nr:histidine kinase dimerization/phospho-acceptor domain-containing protein [Virgibacillus siamensis]
MKDTMAYNTSIMQESKRLSNCKDSLQKEPFIQGEYHIGEKATGYLGREFRNSMTGIKGFLQLIKQNSGSLTENNLKRYSQLMINEIQYMENVITDLLVVTKSDNYQITSESMVSLLKETVKQMEKTHHIQVTSHVKNGFSFVRCVREQIILAFVYLIYSIESMSESKALMINVKQYDATNLKITITGEGDTNSSSCFGRIEDALSAAESNGNGLDLMIVLNVVENHGGYIQAFRNKENKWAFEVIFPFDPNKFK